jgi:hypothetical protein
LYGDNGQRNNRAERNHDMQLYLSFILVLLISLTHEVQGQEATPGTGKRIVVREFWMNPGIYTTPRNNGSLEDFRQLVPTSLLLREPMEGYNTSAIVINNGGGGFATSIGIRFRDRKGGYRHNPVLRVGLGHNSGDVLRRNVQRRDQITFDTLQSMTTGKILLQDSIRYSSYDMTYRADHLLLDVSLLFRTNPARQWSFYSGIGVAGGISLQARTIILHSMFSQINIRTPEGKTLGTSDFNVSPLREEQYRMPNNTVLQGYVPLGVDLRVGTNNAFLRKLHLFKELRPGFLINHIPGHRTVSFARFYMGGGIRVVLHE